ncbi:MAG: hypothetical protein ABJF11_00130 [Reichenbachiella sp.]|uniref:hypothetical protein n=1 Tax=Reichenbachiella sp. TaxID=2184521 RepID=UPI003266568E
MVIRKALIVILTTLISFQTKALMPVGNYFDKDSITQAFIKNGENKVYLNSPHFDLNHEWLQKKLSDHFKYINFNEAIEDDVQGLLMVAITLDEKGYLTNYKLLNSLHFEIDSEVFTFFMGKTVIGGSPRLKLKPAKLGKEKVSMQVVVPIAFNIERPYRATNYYYYDSHFIHQQIMYDQYIRYMDVPTPPANFY